ncbi:translocation/assembly module TamB domain-containing protein [Ramlibacter sp. USB13]|uniref:Translocation/assembly module TamB domain-containing protein n=1 Tax=Ramlibacter cellulosilyticus TaxID=2764187 RepID=A0A923MSF4_9BURK|nr:translocation/assembly module TamB domain-containing protein [Ramlibacter cellulosilyticus]MBC5784335.1 translocation/assembly module TamB domain-containing protein [Ramlibacter cellulosilyticus]
MKAAAASLARWTVRVLVGFGLLLALAAAVLWWWAGQEGSLEWTLRRIGGSVPLQSEGVTGSLRGGWHVDRIVWERDGLRLEAEDIRLEWQPLAMLNRTLQLQLVHVARARVVDTRPKDDEPLKEPENLRLPWRVEVESLKVGSLKYEGRTQVEASQLEAAYAFDGLRHRASVQSLQVAGGSYSGDLALLAIAPLTIDAKLRGRFTPPMPEGGRAVPLELEAKAEGPAAAVAVRAQLKAARSGSTGEAPSATVQARLTPFAKMPVPRADAELRAIDAALFWPSAPRTSLSGTLQVRPQPGNVFRLQADVRNGLAGPWDSGRLPLASLRGAAEWREGTALLESLSAQAGGGTVEGNGRWQGEGWRFEGRVDGVDPAQLHTALASLPLSGPLKLDGEGRAVGFDVALAAGRPGRKAPAVLDTLDLRDVTATGRWSGDTLRLSVLRVRTSDAQLEGEGEVAIAARAGSGRLELRAPGLQLQARGSLAETRGQGNAELQAGDLARLQRWIARWPGAGAAVRDLALRGQADAQVAWQGGWRDPTVQARATARSVGWQSPPPADSGAPPAWTVRDAVLQVQGRLRDAALDLRGQAEQGQRQVSLATRGRLGMQPGTATSWRGNVATLDVQMLDPSITPGPWRLELQRPVDWRAAGGTIEVGAGEALLRAPAMRSGAGATDAVLAWSPVRRQGGQLTTAGRLSGLPLAWLELVGGAQLGGAALSGDLVFDAQWNAQLGSTVRVDASLARVRGDVNVLAETADGGTARVTAGVREARVTASTVGDQLEFRLLWDSERAGHAEGVVRSRLVRSGDGWAWPEQAPLSGRLQANLPRIGVWSLLAPPGWRLRGSLVADVQFAGTRAQPDLSGTLRADELALRSVVDGIELRNGRVRAELAGRKVVVTEFVLHGSQQGGGDGGSLVATGEGSWTAEGPRFSVDAQLSQLRASVRSDRQLTVSGTAAARMDRSGTRVTGNLRVDRARIQVPDESPPRLGEDVVVRNAGGVAATEEERRKRPPAAEGGSRLDLRLAFDLGPDFRVSGRGLDTRLAGTVEVQGSASGTPQIVGVIQTVGGTYEAYGQRMKIDRGELRFTGPPDNPALDILAIRPNMVQKVGVQVTGRAQSPHVELYSDAGLSDAETLSYVVLGRSSAGSGAETALLQRAATALLAGRGGKGKGIAGSLGLDDLSVTPDSTSGAVVRVGKRFAENFYAAYERSLQGAMGTLYLFYDVSRKLTVRAEAGERTGLDLIWTFSFQ